MAESGEKETREERVRRELAQWQERRRQARLAVSGAQDDGESAPRREEEAKSSLLSSLLQSGRLARRSAAFARAQTQKARLLPVLSLQHGRMAMEMKLGRSRMYLVRDMFKFCAQIAGRELVEYGKEFTFSHCEDEVDERDAQLMRHLVLIRDVCERGERGELLLTRAALDTTMRLLVGREVELRAQDGEMIPATVREGSAQAGVQLTPRQGGGAMLRVTAQSAALGDSGAYFLLPERGEVLCATGEDFQRVAGLIEIAQRAPRGVRLDGEELDAVCARLLLPAGEAARIDKGIDLVREHTPDALRARFLLDGDDAGRIVCRVEFSYGEDGEAKENVRQDTLAEEDALACVQRLFPERLSDREFAFSGKEDEVFELLGSRCGELEVHGEVLVSERLSRRNVQKRRAMSFGLSPSGGELLLRTDLGGFTQQELDEAAQAYREKRRYVRLQSGAFLSGEALEQAAQAAQVLEGLDVTQEQAAQGVPVSEARVLYLERALKGREQMRLVLPKRKAAFIERLREAQNTRAQQPSSLNATLRPYQLDGLTWLCALSDAGFGGLLADDMGLGKTIQVLSLLLREMERGEAVRALVVCPASLQLNWLREAEKFAPSLQSRVLAGGAKERERAIGEEGIELLITSYDQLRRDAQLYEGKEFTHVLLDEAQQIKNAASQAAQAVKTLCAAHRFAMTGTPVENRLSELWSIFDFLMPGYLLSYKRFRERFELPAVRDGKEKAMENLRLMVAPFILRRLKSDVLSDLPEKVESVLTSEMTEEQRKQYAASAARLMGEAEGALQSAQGRVRVLAGLTRLRQLCCDPRLCLEEYAGGSGKLAQCVELAQSAAEAGHRMLLFSQFTSMLDLLREALHEAGLNTLTLTGETEKVERQRLCDAFNAGEGDVFLISLKAGGTGLNLTGADTVIHYDPWWNTAAQNQATDRAYRIGQTRGVQVFRLIAADSIEERILLMQQEKNALGEGVLAGGDGLQTFDEKTLRKLIGGL